MNPKKEDTEEKIKKMAERFMEREIQNAKDYDNQNLNTKAP